MTCDLCLVTFFVRRDPYHHDRFLTDVVFLPLVNNYVDHSNSSRYRANFVRTPTVHLFGSSHDEIIMPWQSSLIGCDQLQICSCSSFPPSYSGILFFRFWNISNPSQMLNMSDVPEFTQDLFGLQTLFEAKRLFLHSVDGVLHQDWLDRTDVFANHILPLLQLE